MDDLVAQIITSGGGASVLVWLLIRFIKPGLEERGASKFAINMTALAAGVLISIALTFVLGELQTWQSFVLAMLIGLSAAGVATYGHEAVKNYGRRNITNVDGGVHIEGDAEIVGPVAGESAHVGDDNND